jgi:hypothetical protein
VWSAGHGSTPFASNTLASGREPINRDAIKAEQFYTTNPPGFHWKARFKMFGLWIVKGDDTYKAGHGHMFGKIAGLYTIFDARGPELDQGTMLRYLNEMTWFPIALLSDYVTWQAADDVL